MKSNLAIFVAAMTLSQAFAGKKDELKTKLKDQQAVCEKANKAHSDETDANQRMVLAETAKTESEKLIEGMTALSILEKEELKANTIVDKNRATAASFGFLVHKPVLSGSIADAVAAQSQSFWSRVF